MDRWPDADARPGYRQDMESSLALATEEGPLARPATTEITSPDAGTWSAMALPSSPPTETTWKAPSGTSSAQGSQFSPANYALDLCTDASSIPATARSASSPFTDRWSMGYADQDQGDEYALWHHPDQGSHDAQPMPKLEPLDDDVDLSEVKLAPSTPSPLSDGSQTQQRRPRGRLRKNSSSVAASATKVTKGRSKTGCITCRKRKKKCDEAKPRCMNCEKNAVVCEGYHEKHLWKSGKERADEERLRRASLPTVTLQPLFNGVETAEDWIFWRHYVNHLATF